MVGTRWLAYLAPPACHRVRYMDALTQSHKTCNVTGAAIMRDLHAFQPYKMMDFWMDNERLDETLAAALRAWDASAVDWELLHKISHISANETFLGGQQKDPRRHTDADTCSTIFVALPELREKIMRVDSMLFEKFNYSMC